MSAAPHPKSLVLVVGAGARKEVNLPVGAELRTKISEALDIRYEDSLGLISGDPFIAHAIQDLATAANRSSGDVITFFEACHRIRDAMPQAISIDNFIDSHQNDQHIVVCGKLAIAHCILAAEAESTLFFDRHDTHPQINFADLQGTWFNFFFQLLIENCQEAELDQRMSQVAIASFNYDRCVAHYLHGALQNYYGVNSERAAQAMSNLLILHPYGSVGSLPWQVQRDGVDYGSNPRSDRLIEISKGIKTFTEGIDPDSSSIMQMQRTIEHAQKLVFLGFAFHPQNVQLLFPGLADGQQVVKRSTYATGHGISDADGQVIRNELSNRGAVSKERFDFRNDLTCAMLFKEYWLSLSLVR